MKRLSYEAWLRLNNLKVVKCKSCSGEGCEKCHHTGISDNSFRDYRKAFFADDELLTRNGISLEGAEAISVSPARWYLQIGMNLEYAA